MKNLLVLFLFLPLFAHADANLTSITNALSEGDANQLSEFFDQNIEIAVLDDEDVYNKSQATTVIKNFFESNKPTSFSQVHQGEGEDSRYCIGNLTTSSTTFRVYIYMKVDGGAYKIQELRFDEE